MKSIKKTASKLSKKAPVSTAAVLTGTTGIALISAAAVGVAGFFAWKNREKILSFVGQYIDLPESLQSENKEAWDSDKGTAILTTDSYSAPTTTEHRM